MHVCQEGITLGDNIEIPAVSMKVIAVIKCKLLKDTHNQTCDKYVDVIPLMFRFEKSVHMNTR